MARFLITLLGSSKENCDWHIFKVSILFVRKKLHKIIILWFLHAFQWSTKPYTVFLWLLLTAR